MSYAFTGYKWGVPEFGEPSGEITWSSDLSALPFDELAYDLGDFDDELARAFQAWEDAAAIDFTRVASGGDVRVTVGTLDQPKWVAVTEWAATETPGLEQFASVRVTFDSQELWAPNTGNGFDLQNLFAVAAHEIGHVIGLEHVDDPGQIMYATTLGPTSLQTGDITGAQILYGADAGDPDLGPLPEPPTPEEVDRAQAAGDGGGGDGGGGGGGMIVALLGGLLALILGVFGAGSAPLGALAVAQSRSEEDEETLRSWGDEALDLLPTRAVAEEAEPFDETDALGEDLLDWV